MRFLLSRRWLIFAILVALGAWGAWLLGQWQFHRLEERRQSNHQIASNLNAPPVPVDMLLKPGRAPSAEIEWRRVTVHGTYDDAHAVVLKYQTRNGAAGVDVVTPLRTASGAAVLVDRGWMGTENSGATRPKLPPSTPGTVTVTGFVRQNASGGATDIGDMSTRAVSSVSIGHVVPYPLYGGFVDLAHQAPRPAKALAGAELPDDTSDGPHFFYGLQWWFFGALAIFGFFFLMYDEWQQIRNGTWQKPSERPKHPTVDGQHRPSDE
ncbi:SURF1 family cytochrome oxidase biogenesis protein [Nocardioides terrisoli]|uniref:SURF1 family cytochrome oxidase biogenesis protein n=1 Tax=Nocardioides terrisoli TaxID=3388267 RepID=UPI00287B61ED|nr:SURF1 family protein [Nocardioides marmorisolisilvae]